MSVCESVYVNVALLQILRSIKADVQAVSSQNISMVSSSHELLGYECYFFIITQVYAVGRVCALK